MIGAIGLCLDRLSCNPFVLGGPASSRRWFVKKVLITFSIIALVIGGAVAVVVYVEMSKGYTATVRFERRVDLTAAENSSSHGIETARDAELIRMLARYDFKSRAVLDQLIKDVDELHRDLPRTDDNMLTEEGEYRYRELIAELKRAISVSIEKQENGMEVVSVSVKMENGELAADVANKLVEAYLKKVRNELDDALIQKKKFFTAEVMRYRRKLSELETQKTRFAAKEVAPGITGLDVVSNPDLVRETLNTLPKLKTKRSELDAKIKYLLETAGDEKLGDQAAIQLAQWKAERDTVDAAIAKSTGQQDALNALVRNHTEMLNEWKKINQEITEAQDQLKFWNDELTRVKVLLTMAVSERGMQIRVIENARKPPRKGNPSLIPQKP